jgi:hypothetical protein
LGAAGIKVASDPASVSIGIQAAGYVILLAEPGRPETRIIGGERAALPAAEQMKVVSTDQAAK